MPLPRLIPPIPSGQRVMKTLKHLFSTSFPLLIVVCYQNIYPCTDIDLQLAYYFSPYPLNNTSTHHYHRSLLVILVDSNMCSFFTTHYVVLISWFTLLLIRKYTYSFKYNWIILSIKLMPNLVYSIVRTIILLFCL